MSSKLSLLWLQAFVAVARSDTLQDAAARAGLSTSTLSSHLRNLENHLGASLFDHSKRPLVLTANGQRFLHHAEAVLERLGPPSPRCSAKARKRSGSCGSGSSTISIPMSPRR